MSGERNRQPTSAQGHAMKNTRKKRKDTTPCGSFRVGYLYTYKRTVWSNKRGHYCATTFTGVACDDFGDHLSVLVPESEQGSWHSPEEAIEIGPADYYGSIGGTIVCVYKGSLYAGCTKLSPAKADALLADVGRALGWSIER